MIRIGPVEKKVYELRADHPVVIPQIDPSSLELDKVKSLLKEIKAMGIDVVAMGGSIVDRDSCNEVIDVAVKDFDLSVITYLTQTDLASLNNYPGKTAVYWMSVLNSENMFYLRDVLVMSSVMLKKKGSEAIPTAYVFDDRGPLKTATWLSRATHVPREKPTISLSLAVHAQNCGFRFYIMAGGSGAEIPPPESHVALLSKETDLFIMPTSGIKNVSHAEDMFKANADAIHIGNLLEQKDGIDHLSQIVKASKKYPGKDFLP